jgi:hypothetical protein
MRISPRHLDFALRRRQHAQHDQLAAVDSFQHPDAQTIRPRWAGEPFDMHACVEALFTIKRPTATTALDQQAASLIIAGSPGGQCERIRRRR